MANYIDKNELLNAIDKRNGRLPLWLDEILMQDCKVADVAPIVHGHWEETEDTVWDEEEECLVPLIKCSVCSAREREDEDCPYCRRCGAKMDEEAQNDP